MTDISERIGKNIRRLRVKKGMSQPGLEAVLGCRNGAVSRWELGYNAPNALYLLLLSQAFDCKVDDLYTEEG